MQSTQQLPQESPSPANGHSTLHDLFALTDEQILEIEPEAQDVKLSGGSPATVEETARVAPARSGGPAGSPANAQPEKSRLEASATQAPPGAAPALQPGLPAPPEPPPWLAVQMKDPWNGEEAKELWNGIQQAKQEAAAYRAAFANPEDARALKELYPGGVSEARAAAERSRVLDDIDRAYFGAAGGTPEQTSAARAQLAQTMLREDPAAFRGMVLAGLRALENNSPVGATLGSPVASTGTTGANGSTGGAPSGPGQASPAPTAPASVEAQPAAAGGPAGDASAHEAHVAAYAAFEKAANEDLERSVGAAIERTLAQALPAAPRSDIGVRRNGETQARGPALQDRLSAAVRQDIESALKGDRQLGEQIAQILSSRRFDDETRAQVVRLIGERAQHLVPGAARRVINEWTQTTLAAHRGNAARADAASARREVATASVPAGSSANISGRTNDTNEKRPDSSRGAARSDSRRVDYRKLSDEQILEM